MQFRHHSMDLNSKIYIAGHTGLVGSAILRTLESNGFKNIITKKHSELDLTRQSKVEEFIFDIKPDYVFLAAAKVGGILANNTYKADFIYDNIMIVANIINASYKAGVRKLLNMGSSCIYPKFSSQPLKEEYLLTGTLEPTNEPYAIAKIAAIKLCRYYNEQINTNFISVMPTNVFGPNDNFNLETAHVLPALIRKFHLAKLIRQRDFQRIRGDLIKYPPGFGMNFTLESDENHIESCLDRTGITGSHVVLWGKGTAFREFLYVDDLADACIYLMKNYNYDETGEFVNVGTGKDICINDLADMVKGIIGFDGYVKHDLSMPDGTPKKLLDVSRLKALGWEASTGLREGIKKTYEWYLRSVNF